MKTLKMLTLVVAIAFSSVLSAGTNPTKKAESTIITETIGSLLKNPRFHLESDAHIIVDFFVNKDNQIVVLSVDTDNTVIENYIKGRLNYRKLPKTAIKTNRFKIPVMIKKSN
ncbi:hypothetical protein [Winogradskyella endarachnes]|uniref:TonB C-terminal domain-containing protein n=1 Tax=Winogradskyella endarachnes TaxID=2681965 RepID=A0A6L6U750_9FLAO|nr:hypothetical protein [Winogradskyella endarachnes]MUU78110.1 hypothetical protein [Winogradskyella endarachnes]